MKKKIYYFPPLLRKYRCVKVQFPRLEHTHMRVQNVGVCILPKSNHFIRFTLKLHWITSNLSIASHPSSPRFLFPIFSIFNKNHNNHRHNKYISYSALRGKRMYTSFNTARMAYHEFFFLFFFLIISHFLLTQRQIFFIYLYIFYECIVYMKRYAHAHAHTDKSDIHEICDVLLHTIYGSISIFLFFWCTINNNL